MSVRSRRSNGDPGKPRLRSDLWVNFKLVLLLACHFQTGFSPGISRAQDKLEKNYSFRLTSYLGDSITQVPDSDSPKARFTVICFLGTECPLARLYGPRLMELSREYGSLGVRFVGVMSNRQDSKEDIARYVSETGVTFPIAQDLDGTVAEKYGAERTPEIFVLNDRLELVYRGRVDDQYQPGISRQAPTKNDLRDALRELISGMPVSRARTESVGCRIGRSVKPSATATTTYSEQVRAVLQRNCVECHRPGEIGPFALTEYHEIIGWGSAMLEAIDDGRMPPWHASPKHGKFANARWMTEADKQVLRDWVAEGMPLGDHAKASSAVPFAAQNPTISHPDAVFAMRDRPFAVPASGTVEYQYFVVDPAFKTDQWVSAAEITPGNRSVVHHAIVFIRPPDGGRFRGVGWLSAYVPGQRNVAMPPGHARLIPNGSKLVFQMHYTPTGTKQEDLTRIAISFVPESEVTHEVFTLAALDQEFEIPPGAADHPVQAHLDQLPEHGKLLAIAPHMHYRGKSFRVEAQQGDRIDTLLDVPRYDFNWQHSYVLAEPRPLADINSLQFTAKFDNSPANPFNPDPAQYVTWGDQTWEEMAIAFFEVSEPRTAHHSNHGRQAASPQIETPGATSQKSVEHADPRIEKFVEEFFSKLDINKDGRLLPSESPLAVKQFSFYQFDIDKNNVVTRGEVEQVARQILR